MVWVAALLLPSLYEFTWSRLFHFSRPSRALPRVEWIPNPMHAFWMSGVALPVQREFTGLSDALLV